MKPKLYIPCVLCGISFRWVVIVDSIPAVLAVLVLIVFVKEHRGAAATAATTGLPKNIPGYDKKFWMFLGILRAFTLGNSSDFFVILRAQNLNVSLLMVVLMLVMFNMTSAAISLPAGILSDKLGRRKVIAIGWSVYALVYLGFALATGLWSIWLLFAYYGIYYGMVKGVARAYVAIFSEREVRDCLWAVLWCCWTYSTARQSVGRMDVG